MKEYPKSTFHQIISPISTNLSLGVTFIHINTKPSTWRWQYETANTPSVVVVVDNTPFVGIPEPPAYETIA